VKPVPALIVTAVLVTLMGCSTTAGAPAETSAPAESPSASHSVVPSSSPTADGLQYAWTRQQLMDACIAARQGPNYTTWQSVEEAEITFEGDRWDVYVEGNNPNISDDINDALPCSVQGTPDDPDVTLLE
jgi:hypothetical protein